MIQRERGGAWRRAAPAIALGAALLAGCAGAGDEDAASGAVNSASGEQVAEMVVTLSETQRELAGVSVEPLTPKVLPAVIRAPGEVMLDAYATSQVTPRIQAQVVARQAKLGDAVEKGQPLVTLSSVEMADAQGRLIIADREWRRVQNLGREVVSEQRFVEARVAARQTRATVLAYGMTAAQVEELLADGEGDLAGGRFTLLASQSGTVIRDDFVVGEMIDPGRVLFEVSDTSKRWVEARIPPAAMSALSIGDDARIRVGGQWIDGRMVQRYQALDEATRTLPVRIEVVDTARELEPGVFVDVEIHAGPGKPALVLPQAAVLPTPTGEWEVFVETRPGEYRPTEVTVLDTVDGLTTISGIDAGTRVVAQGAFFLQSELGKSGFVDDDD